MATDSFSHRRASHVTFSFTREMHFFSCGISPTGFNLSIRMIYSTLEFYGFKKISETHHWSMTRTYFSFFFIEYYTTRSREYLRQVKLHSCQVDIRPNRCFVCFSPFH